jgi:uncharacterized protein (DUF2384 family)
MISRGCPAIDVRLPAWIIAQPSGELAGFSFGGREKAGVWLRRPTTALGGECPLLLLDTDEGARAVETLLGPIAHRIAA